MDIKKKAYPEADKQKKAQLEGRAQRNRVQSEVEIKK
jgi:hypothetical protein